MIYVFDVVPTKSQQDYHVYRQAYSKIYKERDRSRIAKIILTKKNTILGIILLNIIKVYYLAVIIKTMWFWLKNRHIDHWNVIENSQIEPQKYAQLIFDKDRKYNLLFYI